MKTIVLCGGHLTPALASIDELEDKNEYKIVFFGRKKATDGSQNLSAEYREITKRKIIFVNIITGRFTRTFTKYTLPSILKIPFGFLVSLFYLHIYRPSLIVSFGGYLSTPVVVSGWLLGIGSIAHEQAAVPGLAAKINSLFVKKIFLTWPQSQKYFPEEKCEVIGNLQPKSFLKSSTQNKEITSFLEKKGDLVLVLGGSQGSHAINTLVFENLDLFSRYLVFHQIGTANYKNDHEKASKIKKNNYFAVDYVSPQDLGAVYKRAKFTVSRSGANTVWDLAMLAKVAILIPLPISSSGEQMANASILKHAGSAIVIGQKEFARKALKNSIDKMEKNYLVFKRNADAFAKTLPKDPAQNFTQYLTSNL